jgi:hypothetical protein
MAITYSWEVESLITKTVQSNEQTVVQVAAFRVATDSDTGSVVKKPQSVFYIEDEINLENMTAFSSLTEETVAGWLETHMGEESIDYLDTRLAFWIGEKNSDLVNPRTNNAPPWS